MLDTAQLTALFDTLGTPQAGRQLVTNARIHAPVRDVQSRGGNVITMFSSRKMAVAVPTESRHIEFAAVVGHEYDSQVLEYYAQPCELKLELVDPATGEIRTIRHFPDFLVLRADGLTLEEWKSETKLTRLAEKTPYRYVRNSDGRWYSPQIEEQLAKLGLRYCIRSDASVPQRRTENLLHLADYFHPGAEAVPPHELARLRLALKEHGSLFLSELLTTPYRFNADVLNKAIADHLVVADLDREVLTEPRRARLYRDEATRDFLAGEVKASAFPGLNAFSFEIAEGSKFVFDETVMTIRLVGAKEVVCSREHGDDVTLTRAWLLDAHAQQRIQPVTDDNTTTLQDIASYSTERISEALRRNAMLQSNDAREILSERTMRRWLKKQQLAISAGGNEVLALAPQIHKRGNREARLDDFQLRCIEEVINEHWATPEAKNYRACHKFLEAKCNDAGVVTPSYPNALNFSL